MSTTREVCQSALCAVAVATATLLGLGKASDAHEGDFTWEAMLCKADAIVEVELTVADRTWGVGKRVQAVRVLDVLMNLPNPGTMPKLDDLEGMKDEFADRIDWQRRHATRDSRFGALFKEPSDPTTWRVVVFLYKVVDASAFGLDFGSAESSGVSWTNHKRHRSWKRLLRRYIRKRMRAYAKGVSQPPFCSRRAVKDSAFKRYTLPPPCEEPCEERSRAPDRKR